MLKQQEHIGKPLFSSNLFFFKFIFYNSSFFVVADRTMTYQVGNFYKRFFYVCKNTPMCEYIKKSLSLCFRFKQERREIWFLPLERSFSTETTSARHLRMEKKKVFFVARSVREKKDEKCFSFTHKYAECKYYHIYFLLIHEHKKADHKKFFSRVVGNFW